MRPLAESRRIILTPHAVSEMEDDAMTTVIHPTPVALVAAGPFLLSSVYCLICAVINWCRFIDNVKWGPWYARCNGGSVIQPLSEPLDLFWRYFFGAIFSCAMAFLLVYLLSPAPEVVP